MKKNSFYNVENITGIMSLRKPQAESLVILDKILSDIELSKKLDLKSALEKIHNKYPICTDFERDFISLTYALATGVGKTRLMGAFITYLYANYGYNNYFVVAPNTTIYNKLKNDLGEVSSDKFVFKGLNEVIKPRIISGDDYKYKQISYIESNVNIFVYNISKFDKDNAKMKKRHENIGESFFAYLSKIDNLIMLMDESHHYRAEKGFASLNELKPILGLEFTATPYITIKNKQVNFKNVVYDYPLAKAIADGFTRTPYAITRKNLSSYKFGDEELDKLMISDGINNHERIKNKLYVYSKNNNKKLVKPFVLIVCKDTEHAEKIKSYISTKDFKDGKYIDKIVIVHSKQTKTESDANIEELLKVEKFDNPIEIVIHVDKLKEGWDVNNLYTIIPLRTATSKILREQMIGRGLRLPFGERVGDDEIDGVYLTAHDKFDEILEEAEKGDSIFKKEHIINIDDNEDTYIETSLNLYLDIDNKNKSFYESNNIQETIEINAMLCEMTNDIKNIVETEIINNDYKSLDKEKIYKLATEKCNVISKNEDYASIIEKNKKPIFEYLNETIEEMQKQVFDNYIPIPKIMTRVISPTEYIYNEFELDYKRYDYKITENELLIKSIVKNDDIKIIKGDYIDFEAFNEKKTLVEEIIKHPEIDYEKCKNLIYKLIEGLFFYIRHKLNTTENGIKNIVMMNKYDIADKIYNEILNHITYKDGLFEKEIIGVNNKNIKPIYSYSKDRMCRLQKDYKSLDENHNIDIKSVLFVDLKKSIFSEVKFDSRPEWQFAKMLDVDADVIRWLRPTAKEFNITYAGNKNYEPDFVVETKDSYYLVEIKRNDATDDEDVVAKKEEAILYCELASNYCKNNNMKEWKYMFVKDKQISSANMFDYYLNNCLEK